MHAGGDVETLIDDVMYQQQGLQSKQKLAVKQTSAVQVALLCTDAKMRSILRGRNLLSSLFHQLSGAATEEGKLTDVVITLSTLLTIALFGTNQLEASCLPSECIKFLLDVLRTPPELSKTSACTDLTMQLSKIAQAIGFISSTRDQKCAIQPRKTAIYTLERLLKQNHKFSNVLLCNNGFGLIVEIFSTRLAGLTQISGDSIGSIQEMILCLRVLDIVTCFRSEAQQSEMEQHIRSHKKHLLSELCSVLDKSEEILCVPDFEFEVESIRETSSEYLLAVLRVLVNLTNEDADAGATVSAVGGLNAASSLLLFTGESQYDLLALTLGLLINCVEYATDNKQAMKNIMVKRSQQSAREFRRGRGGGDHVEIPALQLICELFTARAASKSGHPQKQAQDSAIAGYAGLLIGCISVEESIRKDVLTYLQAPNFDVIKAVLRQFIRDQRRAGIASGKMTDSIENILTALYR